MTTRGRTTTLIGRADEIETLREALTAARAGLGRVVLLEGEAGIGKTSLVQHSLAKARTQGLQVLEAACDDLERTRPFAAVAKALGITSASSDPDRAAVAELLAQDATSPSSTAGIQFRVVEALGDIVERLASGDPIVLALEDLHWADVSTLIALRSIARRIGQLPVLLLGTCRPGHEIGELHRVMDDLLRAGGTLLPLGPLDDEAVVSLVSELLGSDPSPALIERLQGATGNPLFITEYMQALFALEPDLEDPGMPLEFRLTVLRRLGHLSKDTNNVVRLASVLGSNFSPTDLSAVLDKSLIELAPLLQQAVVGGVITDRGERLAFRHDLVRDAVYEHIPVAVRKELHREVGRSLAAAGIRPLVVAHHLGLGAETQDPEAADWLRRAAREAAPHAPAVAVELLERARDLMGLTSPDRGAVLADLVMALAWSGRLADAVTLSLEVLALQPEPEVAGALRCGLVYALIWQGRPAEAMRNAVTTPDEHLSDRDATLLLAEGSVARLFSFDMHGAGVQASQAVADATALGHELAMCHALTAQAWSASFSGRPEEAIELARRAIDIADRSETGEPHLAHPRFFPGMPLVSVDRLDEAEDVLQTGRRIAEEMGLVWSLPLYHAHLGTKRFVAGDWDGAIAEFEASLAIADEVGMGVGVIAGTAGWLAVIQLHRDDLEGAEQTVGRAMSRLAETGPQLGMGLLNWARAMVLEARGDLEPALALLQTAWDLYIAGGPITDPWSAMALVRMCVKTENIERAAALLPFVDDQASLLGTPFMQGQALRCRGLVEKDPEILIRAVTAYRLSPRVHELASACEDAGVHLAEAERLDEAVSFLDEAIDLYEDLGAVRDTARVRAALRKYGVVRSGRVRQARATSGWESLTKTELKVVSLVAQRLSNPEVAERLFISRHTVESHLKHIYQKMSLSSRVELAAEASRHSV